MTDPWELAHRYLERQASLGPSRVVLPRAGAARLPAGQRSEGAPRPPSAQTDDQPRAARPERIDASEGVTIEAPPGELFSNEPIQRIDSLRGIADVVAACTRCRLCEGRTHTVPGEGPTDARLVVVGEGPGRVEDETGRPFVGPAGELLTKILAAIDLPRERVYICNVVKCRPPENRAPADDEMRACLPYLYRQLDLIRPKVILAMGGTAAGALLETRVALGQLRRKVHRFRGTPLIVTYHPAALLRNPNWKRPTWDDVRLARQLLDT